MSQVKPSSPNSSAEVAILLACARTELLAGQGEQIRTLLAETVDWSALMRLAELHGLRPLLFRHLAALAPERIPKPVHAELWSRSEHLRRRNRYMVGELDRVLAALAGKGIEAIAYKGPLLAVQAYGDLALREFGDLDLLLCMRDVRAAIETLGRLGLAPDHGIDGPALEALLGSRSKYHVALARVEPRLLVELHWKTDAEFPVESLDDPGWWRALQPVPVEGRVFRTLAAPDLFLALSLHGSKHLWSSLGWLVDIAELSRREPRRDWQALLDRCGTMQVRRRFALGLHLMHRLLQVEFPGEVQLWLRGQTQAGAVASELQPLLLQAQAFEPGAMKRLRWNLRLCENWRQRVRHIVDVVLSPGIAEWSGRALPRPLFFLYWPMRWLRLLRKHALGADAPR